jgi:hypothetical protein
MTFKVYVTLGALTTDAGGNYWPGHFTEWIARQGQPGVKVFDLDWNFVAGNSTSGPDQRNSKFGIVNLTPYTTGRSTTTSVASNTWYDDLIVSANDISMTYSDNPVPVTPPPTVSSIAPNSGYLGATVNAIVNGSNLAGATAVTFDQTGVSATIQPGGTAIQLPIAISIASNAVVGSHSMTVTTPGGSFSAAAAFTVQTISSVSTTAPLPIVEVETGNIKVGYVIITPDPSTALPLATVTYGTVQNGIVQSQAGVLPIPMTLDSSMYVGVVSGIGRNLGVALTNPGSSASTLALTLKDPTGAVQAGPASITLQPGQQVSRFVSEFFGSSAVGSGFSGSLRVQGASPFSLLGLLFSGAEFSTLPVPGSTTVAGVPTRTLTAGSTANTPAAGTTGGPGAVIIPQFAMGGGWATQIALVNTSGALATGRIDTFDPLGNPLAVKLNDTTQSTFTYSIAAGGTLLLAPRDTNGQSPF